MPAQNQRVMVQQAVKGEKQTIVCLNVNSIIASLVYPEVKINFCVELIEFIEVLYRLPKKPVALKITALRFWLTSRRPWLNRDGKV